MIRTQRLSVRTTTSSGTTPSGSGFAIGFDEDSANGASRDEEEEIESHPADEEEADSDCGEDKRAHRPVLERFGGLARCYRSGDVLRFVGGRFMCLADHHWSVSRRRVRGGLQARADQLVTGSDGLYFFRVELLRGFGGLGHTLGGPHVISPVPAPSRRSTGAAG